jgi:hypothetical protein
VAYNGGSDLRIVNSGAMDNTNVYDSVGNTMSPAAQNAYNAGVGNMEEDPQFIGNGPSDTNPLTTASPASFSFHISPTSPSFGLGAQ